LVFREMHTSGRFSSFRFSSFSESTPLLTSRFLAADLPQDDLAACFILFLEAIETNLREAHHIARLAGLAQGVG
jgi:cyanate permease